MKNATLFLGMSLFISCHTKRDNPVPTTPANGDLYQYYKVTYNKTKDSTFVSAILYTGYSGLKILITEDNTVLVNGMVGSRKPDSSFSWRFKGLIDVDFALKNNKSQILHNNVSRSEIGDIGFGNGTPSEIHSGDSVVFNFSRTPVQTSESIEFAVRAIDDAPYPGGYKGVSPNLDTTIVIPPHDISLLAPGQCKFVLFRTLDKYPAQTDGNAEGDINIILETERQLTVK